MTQEFIPYEQALELKELGFNELCLFYYGDNEALRIYHQSEIYDDLIGAPLYQQAFRWFREKYNLYQDISTFVWDYDKKQLGFTIRTYLNPLNLDTEKKVHLEVYESYEEAELECLKKLIEIIKQK
jgi:hypothetical protein